MKYIAATILLLAWFITTIILVITVVGLLAFMVLDEVWVEIPNKLLKVFETK